VKSDPLLQYLQAASKLEDKLPERKTLDRGVPVREACGDQIYAMEPRQLKSREVREVSLLLRFSGNLKGSYSIPRSLKELHKFFEFCRNFTNFLNDSAPESTTSVMVKTTSWLDGRP
jgi:hypothetical protein